MSWADGVPPEDSEHTVVFVVLGTVGHREWVEPKVERRTTGTPGHHAVASRLTPASWVAAFDDSRWEGVAADSLPLGWS